MEGWREEGWRVLWGLRRTWGPTGVGSDSGDVGGLWGPPTAVWIHRCVDTLGLGYTLGAWMAGTSLSGP